MTVKIIRNTNWIGKAVPVTVQVKGEKLAKVKHNEQIELDIPGNGATMTVSQTGGRSNKLEVSGGETVEIQTSKWLTLMYVLAVLAPVISLLMPNTNMRLLFLTGLIALGIPTIIFNSFRITKK